MFVEMDHPQHGKIKTVNSPVFISDAEKVAPRPAPEKPKSEKLPIPPGGILNTPAPGTATEPGVRGSAPCGPQAVADQPPNGCHAPDERVMSH